MVIYYTQKIDYVKWYERRIKSVANSSTKLTKKHAALIKMIAKAALLTSSTEDPLPSIIKSGTELSHRKITLPALINAFTFAP